MNMPGLRTPANCRHRLEADGAETATCSLLAVLTGLEASACRVARDACYACCQTFPPTAEAINPIIASLLFERAALVEPARCEPLRARALAALTQAATGTEQPEACPSLWLRSAVPPPSQRASVQVKTWAVGVTTAPRRVATLDDCLDSLSRAGWENPHLFIDASVPLSDRATGLPRTIRDPRVGAWPNYVLALHELLMREPRADAFMLVQDDALFFDREPLRAYLEAEILWPGASRGIVSLYCPSAYTQPTPGWHKADETWGWGALAFVFPNDLARAFLLDAEVFSHRWDGRNHGLAHIDVVIGRWAERTGVAIWYPTPSLVQHVGDASSLWSDARAVGDRRASWFVGDTVRR
jgi:hypothetical protein